MLEYIGKVSVPKERKIIEHIGKESVITKKQLTKKMWKRVISWLMWAYISIEGDTLTLTIKFGDVSVALRAFKYYTTGANPHGNRIKGDD
ncbi:MAG: hypothetical protein NWE90_07390 [Candidatus Bathyarchaeota archaeon]|nr:hypothetical protein [Candidatus Bathyarchaeota archaeon]